MNTNTKPASTILDLDAMMDESLDSVPDMPDFMNPPNGFYGLRIKEAKIEQYETKAKDGKPATTGTRIRVTTEVAETIECEGMPVPNGTLFSETFQGTEDGLGYFKKHAIKVLNVADVKGVPLREILASLAGAEFQAKIKTKTVKANGNEYENLQVNVVPPVAA